MASGTGINSLRSAQVTTSDGGEKRRTDFVGTKPWAALGIFALIVILVYALVFFTPGANGPKLGIDLQGGTRVTLVPQGQQPTQEQLAQAKLILENRVNGMGVSGAEVVTDGNTLVITVPGEDATQARSLGTTSQLVFRTVETAATPSPETVGPALAEVANRWVEYGIVTPVQATTSIATLWAQAAADPATAETMGQMPTVTATPLPEPANSLEETTRREEVYDILIADRQSSDPAVQRAVAALMQCAPDMAPDPLAGGDDLSKPLIACYPAGAQAMLLGPSPLLEGQPADGQRLTGNQIDTNLPIQGGFDTQSGQNAVSFTFKNSNGETASSTWARVTQEYLQRQVAVTLDSQVISAPVVQSATPVGQGTQITGMTSDQEAIDLANNLKYGALPLSFAGENGERGGTTTVIPASLGAASLKAGLIAGLIGLLLVMLFALWNYRLYGFLAIFTLIASGVLVYGALILLGRWIGYSLDLAGIAGLIIGIGTTADSFVVFYERVKDEIREGRTFRSAVPRGWDRARKTIISGNFVSIIAAVVLYILAVGDVKGFAFTLGLTTVFDLVVTFLVTAPTVILASRRPFWSKASVNGMGSVYKLVEERRANGEILRADAELAARRAGTMERVTVGAGAASAGMANPADFEPMTAEEAFKNEPPVPENLRTPVTDDEGKE